MKGGSYLNKKYRMGFIIVILFIVLVLIFLSIGKTLTEAKPSSPWSSSPVISTAANVTTTDAANVTTIEATTAASTTDGITTDTAATTSPLTTTAPVSQIVTTTLAPVTTTEVQTTKGEPTKQEILQIITDAINTIKASDASYIGTKTQDIVIDVTDCSFPAFLSIINGVVDMIANKEVLKYDFTNGMCLDPEEKVQVSAMDTIPPVGTPFALTIDGVASASYEKIGDNAKYSVTLVPETGTFQQPKPTHHGVACDTLDFSLFEIPVGRITKSDFNYPGAIITVTLDKNGTVVGYSEHIDMNGVGEGVAMGISASASMKGYIDEQWEIVWK